MNVDIVYSIWDNFLHLINVFLDLTELGKVLKVWFG